MLQRLSSRTGRHFFTKGCRRHNLLLLRSTSSAEPQSKHELVQNLAIALENNPAVAEEINQAIGSNSARRLEKIIAQQFAEEPSPPTRDQLKMVAFAASIPFFGFGVLDNALMIVAGEAIDATICVKFGLSTMAAAALGNTFSDAVGIYSGSVVEDLAHKRGLQAPRLTRHQEEMTITKVCERVGQLLGIIIGCIVGMFPLLFTLDAEMLKREKLLDEMFATVVDTITNLLDCEAAMLLFLDHEKGQLYPRAKSNKLLEAYRAPIGNGTSGTVAKTGQFLNIDDLPNCPQYYNPERHDDYFGSGIKVQSVLCWPIFGVDPADKCKKVVGVLQVVNKRGRDVPGFTAKDEDIIAAICSHISTSLGTAHGVEEGFKYTLENCERSMNMRGVRLNPAQDARIHKAYEGVMRDCTEALNASATLLLTSDPSSQTGGLRYKVSDNIAEFHRESFPVYDKCKDDSVTLCVNDLTSSPYYEEGYHENYEGSGIDVRAILAAPCISTDGEVLGVLACLKGSEKGSTFSGEDSAFLTTVANNISTNLEGSGASLQRILKHMKSHHLQSTTEFSGPKESALMQEDCSKEVLAIVGSIINLVQKAGGKVDQLNLRRRTSERLKEEL